MSTLHLPLEICDLVSPFQYRLETDTNDAHRSPSKLRTYIMLNISLGGIAVGSIDFPARRLDKD